MYMRTPLVYIIIDLTTKHGTIKNLLPRPGIAEGVLTWLPLKEYSLSNNIFIVDIYEYDYKYGKHPHLQHPTSSIQQPTSEMERYNKNKPRNTTC